MLPPSSQHQSSAHKGSQQTPTITRLAPCFRRKRATAAPGNITHLLITLHRAAEGASACLPGDKHRNPRYILRRAVASKAQTKQSRPSSVCCAKLAVTNAHVGRADKKAKEAAEKALEVERRKAQELLEAQRKMQQLVTERKAREEAERQVQQQLAQYQAELERLRTVRR
eukprot:g5205.t1